MRNDEEHLKLRVASLKELDALVGKYLVKVTPQVFWEEEHACLRFDSDRGSVGGDARSLFSVVYSRGRPAAHGT